MKLIRVVAGSIAAIAILGPVLHVTGEQFPYILAYVGIVMILIIIAVGD